MKTLFTLLTFSLLICSCKKDYRCSCSYTTSAGKYEAEVIENYHSTKYHAERECGEYSKSHPGYRMCYITENYK